MNKRLLYVDVLKAIAIIAVVLYHYGFLSFGYLGVDVFLVINGYLLSKSFDNLSTFRGGITSWLIGRYDYFLHCLSRL
jgi:peptidoglycan/LPS O-acetylase OafA/YrhL